jgi:hypothetical protein
MATDSLRGNLLIGLKEEPVVPVVYDRDTFVFGRFFLC